MCDCVEIIEKQLKEKMAEAVAKDNGEITEQVELSGKVLSLQTSEIGLCLRAEGKYLKGKAKRKYATHVHFNYCPFCGTKTRLSEISKPQTK